MILSWRHVRTPHLCARAAPPAAETRPGVLEVLPHTQRGREDTAPYRRTLGQATSDRVAHRSITAVGMP